MLWNGTFMQVSNSLSVNYLLATETDLAFWLGCAWACRYARFLFHIVKTAHKTTKINLLSILPSLWHSTEVHSFLVKTWFFKTCCKYRYSLIKKKIISVISKNSCRFKQTLFKTLVNGAFVGDCFLGWINAHLVHQWIFTAAWWCVC